MAADRFLFLGTAIALVIQYSITGFFGSTEIAQIALTFTREIIATPFVVRAYFKKNQFPQVKIIGKVTTVVQAIAFPVIILKLSFAWPVVLLTCFIGIVSGITYARDTMN
jgi:phosphatidylglycerophosphate synthase